MIRLSYPAKRRPVFRLRNTFYKLLVLLALGLSMMWGYHFINNHVSAATPTIKSGIVGYCLDVHDDKTAQATPVDIWKCNNTNAQAWKVNEGDITHNDIYCLTVEDSGVAQNNSVVSSRCNGSAAQIWLRDGEGFYNPTTKACLFANKTDGPVTVSSCNDISGLYEKWIFSEGTNCPTSKGPRIACFAAKEWNNWQQTENHASLLNAYTDGTPYEEWCADFVSYIYKEAGYPMINAPADGWDENDANAIQNMGFVKHPVDSGYLPKSGDVAYFDYNGGHVEIVFSGGQTPTFIYGNSAKIDPSTGNGQMAANSLTKEPGLGQLTYYLSPN